MSTTVPERKAALRRIWQDWDLPDWSVLTERFLSLQAVEKAKTILLFYGMGREPDTIPVIRALLGRGKQVALPKCLPHRAMEARQVFGLEDIRPGRFGIPEPGEHCPVLEKQDIDLILVPNLCCDRAGYRLGHGGGYYDRYLADFCGVTVALCPRDWLLDAMPRDAFDVPVDLVIME